MATDKSQEEKVLAQLKETGEVSRNWCLQRYITRLSAIIYNLKKDGYDFEIERRDGDYVYKVNPVPKEISMDF